MQPLDRKELAAAVRADITALNDLFAQLSGATLARVPVALADVPLFLTLTSGLLNTLAMWHQSLLERILRGEARLAFDREPPWAEDILTGWARLPKRQPAARRVEPRLRSLIDGLDRRIAYLDTATLETLPPDPDEVPELLARVLTLERHLSWYLEPSLLARLWPDRWRQRMASDQP
jgi:hypothetical protein